MIDRTRNGELACIHVAKKQLGLDDVTYRDIVRRVSAKFRRAPVESAGLMTERERRALIDELRGFGFRKPLDKTPRNPGLGQEQKIRAIWQALNEAGALRNPTEKGLRAFIKRQTGGVEMPNWLTAEQANKVIEALKAMQKRAADEVVRDQDGSQ
jgi:phage gp16-like protein